jgi:hypothetical protein
VVSHYQTHNYNAHGGRETVIGGKLTFLPGATVEGLREALSASGADAELGGAPASSQVPYVADSTATSAAQLRGDFNALLDALRAGGLMAPEPVAPPGE